MKLSDHMRHVLLYCFERGLTATQAFDETQKANMGEADKPAFSTVASWFKKFEGGDLDLEDKKRSGRPTEVDDEALLRAVEENSEITTRELAEEFGVTHPDIIYHLRSLKMESKHGFWVPHQLTEEQKEARLRVFSSHLQRQKKKPFLHNIVTGDETWLRFENPKLASHWVPHGSLPNKPTPKGSLHPKKVMLCSWWDDEGMIHYEILHNGHCYWWDEEGEHTWEMPHKPGKKPALNGEVYKAQMERLYKAISRKRPNKRRSIILQHDNATPHKTLEVVDQIVSKNRWEILEHPAWSAPEAPSDYHLHHSLKDWQRGKNFVSFEEIVNDFKEFLSSKKPEFFARGITCCRTNGRVRFSTRGTTLLDLMLDL
jgi:histone-lysine N-methyltransferase SETMAR